MGIITSEGEASGTEVEHRLSYMDSNYSNQIRFGMSTSTSVNNFIMCVHGYSPTRDLVCLSELVCFWRDRCILFVFKHTTAHTHTHTPLTGVKSHALNYYTCTPGKKPRANCLRLDQTTVWINCLPLSYFLFFNVSVRAFLIFICSLSLSVLPSFIMFLFSLFLQLVRPVLSLHWHLVCFSLFLSNPLFHFSCFYFLCVYFTESSKTNCAGLLFSKNICLYGMWAFEISFF